MINLKEIIVKAAKEVLDLAVAVIVYSFLQKNECIYEYLNIKSFYEFI